MLDKGSVRNEKEATVPIRVEAEHYLNLRPLGPTRSPLEDRCDAPRCLWLPFCTFEFVFEVDGSGWTLGDALFRAPRLCKNFSRAPSLFHRYTPSIHKKLHFIFIPCYGGPEVILWPTWTRSIILSLPSLPVASFIRPWTWLSIKVLSFFNLSRL